MHVFSPNAGTSACVCECVCTDRYLCRFACIVYHFYYVSLNRACGIDEPLIWWSVGCLDVRPSPPGHCQQHRLFRYNIIVKAVKCLQRSACQFWSRRYFETYIVMLNIFK